MLTVFQCVTMENWVPILYAVMEPFIQTTTLDIHYTELYPPQLDPLLTTALSEGEDYKLFILGLMEKVFYFYFLSVRPCKY